MVCIHTCVQSNARSSVFPYHRFWEQQYFPIWMILWITHLVGNKKHSMDLIHATYLFLLELGFLCYFDLLLLETRFGGCHGNGEITVQARPNGIHKKKKKGKVKLIRFIIR